jgi:hypothetical protein
MGLHLVWVSDAHSSILLMLTVQQMKTEELSVVPYATYTHQWRPMLTVL